MPQRQYIIRWRGRCRYPPGCANAKSAVVAERILLDMKQCVWPGWGVQRVVEIRWRRHHALRPWAAEVGEFVGIAEHRLLVACLFHEHVGLFPLPVIILMTGGESRCHATHCECRDDKQYFQPSLHSACKDNANRAENKINLFIFYPEVPLILSKDNANRAQYKMKGQKTFILLPKRRLSYLKIMQKSD